MAENQKRQTAYKLPIKGIMEGTYVKEGGLKPNYIKLANGLNISRVNLMGVIISKEGSPDNPQVIIEDQSGKIAMRSFGGEDLLGNLEVGGFVMVIGKPREYGNERYIVPEIVKPINDSRWIHLRNLELKSVSAPEISELELQPAAPKETSKNILDVIKSLDAGDGANIDEVIKQFDGAEKNIKNLLEEGEIFEIKPGRLKVLE